MSKVLIPAKTQSVKEIKRKAYIKKRNKLILKIVVIFLALLFLAFITHKIISENKIHYDPSTNIKLTTTTKNMKDDFLKFSLNEKFVVIFNYNSSDLNYFVEILESITYVQSIFYAYNKEVILVLAEVDAQHNLISCQTNQGDLYQNEFLTSEECLSLINEDLALFVVDYPFPNNHESNITLNTKENILHISPNKLQDVYKSILIVANQMFDDISKTQDIINKVQEKLGNLKKVEDDDNNSSSIEFPDDDTNSFDTNSLDANFPDSNSFDTNSLDANFPDSNS